MNLQRASRCCSFHRLEPKTKAFFLLGLHAQCRLCAAQLEPLNYKFMYLHQLPALVTALASMVYTRSSKSRTPASYAKRPQACMKSPGCLPCLLFHHHNQQTFVLSSACCNCSQLLKHVSISVSRLRHKELFQTAASGVEPQHSSRTVGCQQGLEWPHGYKVRLHGFTATKTNPTIFSLTREAVT